MTKEELEKEAIRASDKKCVKGCSKYYRYGFQDGYIIGAEPREKRIAELELTNKRISDECHRLVDTLEKKQNENELLETQNIKLQAEVSRLTIKNADLIGKIAFTENALNNAKAQIEKMKNCKNCKNEKIEGACGHFTQVGCCKNWELAK